MAAAMQGRMASRRSITYSKLLHGVFRRGYAQAELQFPPDVNIEKDVLEKMERQNIKKRKHPGRFAQNTLLPVPGKLVSAADILLAKYGNKHTADEAKKMDRSIMGRHPPPEPEVLQKKVDAISQRLEKKSKRKKDPATMNEEELNVYNKNKDNMIQFILRKSTHLQKSINYTGYTTIVYLLARLSKNYNIIHTCLSEIAKRNPDFVPSAVYNVGSGLGTAVWACNTLWGPAVTQYYCVDKSPDMSTIARLLLQGGDEYKKMTIPGVFFRDKPPSHSSLPFPLVVSAFTLMEQPTKIDRLELVDHLWNMTSEYLVLIENGTYAGHSLIQEAKEWIQESAVFISDDNNGDEPHVFAPCPHDMKCPKFAIKDFKIACTFSTRHEPLKQSKIDSNKLTCLYSYVILKRGKVDTADVKWPRIVQEMKHKDHHSHCNMCCADGSLRHFVVTKRKTQRPVYEILRRSHWGDKVPIDLTEASTDGALYYSEKGVTYSVPQKQKQEPKQQFADLWSDNSEQLENVIDTIKDILEKDNSSDKTDESANQSGSADPKDHS